MKKTVSWLLTLCVLLTVALCGSLPVSAAVGYQLDFTSTDMVYDVSNGAWVKSVGDTTCMNYPGYAVVDKGGAAAIRKFVSPADGPLKMAWGGGVYIDNSQGNLTGATVQFAVTDGEGRILFPKNGDLATVKEGTPLNVELDVASVKKGDTFYIVVMNPSVDRLVCVLNFGVVVNGTSYSNGAGQLYDGILQGGKGWYHQYATNVGKSVAPEKQPDPDENEPQPPVEDTPVVKPGYTIETVTDGFVEMTAFMNNWWWADAQGQNPASPSFGMANGTHTQPPAPGYMTARGFKIEKSGTVTFSGTVLLDINANMGVAENADTIGFMVIEKNSNMVLYPSGSSEFMVLKNTEENRTTPTMISGTYEAKAGDELLFITRNETDGKVPSVQVIMNVYGDVDGTRTLLGNTHEGFSGTQGKNGWRYYYASIKGFKTPVIPAANIFDKAAHFNPSDKAWYLSPEAVTEPVINAYGAAITASSVTVTERTAAAIGYKAARAGKQNFTFTHGGVDAAAKIGFTVVKKATFEPVTAWKLLDAKEQTVSGSFTASTDDEYLFVLAMLGTGDKQTVSVTLEVGGSSLAADLNGTQGNGQLYCYFAPIEDVCSELLETKREETPYLSDDAPGIRDVVFDLQQLPQFDEEKWMWSVGDWENPASAEFMAVLMENAQVSTPNYSLVRGYTAQSDCVISVYGNLFSEVPEFLGAAPNEALFDFMICNSKGQIMYPEDQTGFHTFRIADLTASKPIMVNVSAKINEGEKVYIVFRNRSDKAFAYLYTHFQIFETPEGENPGTPLTGAADGFSDTQGADGWNYYYTTNDSYRFVKGTKLDKVITGGNMSGMLGGSDDDDGDTDPVVTGPDPLWTTLFWVSLGLDIVCVILLALFIVMKLRRPKNDPPQEATT